MSTWADVEVDTHIRDAQGTIWRVCVVDKTAAGPETSPAFRCKSADGEWLTITPKPLEGPVTIVDTTAPLVELLRDQLGAVVLGVKDNATGSIRCEPWPQTPASKNLDPFKFHLSEIHGMFVGDIKGYAKLAAAHQAAHDPEEVHVGKLIPHTHLAF